jgi:hypothetical protein
MNKFAGRQINDGVCQQPACSTLIYSPVAQSDPPRIVDRAFRSELALKIWKMRRLLYGRAEEREAKTK